jgi:hypothetical protein
MDLFENLSKATKNGGLVDIYSGVGVNVSKTALVSLDYHYFRLESPIYDPFVTGEILQKPLGSEFDLTFDYAIIPEINLSGGFSVMLPTTSMEKLQGSMQKLTEGVNGFAYWGWIMVTAKPLLYNNKK